jgi:tRNA(Ile)-lysidine synthase
MATKISAALAPPGALRQDARMDCPLRAALADAPDAPLAVAFSGGLDSSVLLHALGRAAAGRVEALHVNHGLQPQAAGWAEHCRVQAAAWGLGCRVLTARLDPATPGGLEAAARQARYRALADALPPGSVLVLAHHREDQAETILLRLLRRSGPRGLTGMHAHSRSPQDLPLWRPLLNLPRAALRRYADQHRIVVLDDPMNHDPRFDRVHLRQRVLPALRERWPDADAALAASAALLEADRQRRDLALHQALARCRGLDPASLLIQPLLDTPQVLRRPLLEAWLAQLQVPQLPGSLLQRLADGLPADTGRGYASLRWGGWRLERHRDELHAEVEADDAIGACRWDGRRPLQLPGGCLQLLGAEQLPWSAQVTARLGGERLHEPGRQHQRSVKDWLQAHGIPPWERRRLPLLWSQDDQLQAVGDLCYAAPFDHWLRDRSARLRWMPR